MANETILIVDDEPNLVRLMEMTLKTQGYSVVKAGDGKEALEILKSCEPDLILLDVQMPHVDGFELLRTLKSDPLLMHIPVAMQTVRSHDQDIFHSLEGGAEYYLTKPIEPHELLTFCKRVFEGTLPPHGNSSKADGAIEE